MPAVLEYLAIDHLPVEERHGRAWALRIDLTLTDSAGSSIASTGVNA
jgi:hypothetical protein